jgi:hypothetical protein
MYINRLSYNADLGFDHFPTDPELEEMTSTEPPGY